jgi:hypothetical protein
LFSQGPGTYVFGYDIEEPENGNMQFRQEERLPNGTVTGSYGVVEPDGNVRVVRYIADSMGYRCTKLNSSSNSMSDICIRTGTIFVGRDSSAGITTSYTMEGPGIESR